VVIEVVGVLVVPGLLESAHPVIDAIKPGVLVFELKIPVGVFVADTLIVEIFKDIAFPGVEVTANGPVGTVSGGQKGQCQRDEGGWFSEPGSTGARRDSPVSGSGVFSAFGAVGGVHRSPRKFRPARVNLSFCRQIGSGLQEPVIHTNPKGNNDPDRVNRALKEELVWFLEWGRPIVFAKKMQNWVEIDYDQSSATKNPPSSRPWPSNSQRPSTLSASP
jgi:hypothetical protein